MNNKNIPYREIGDRINTLMAETNTMQKDLAEHLKVSPNIISYYCGGSRRPSTEQLIQIANYFGSSVDYLLGRTTARSEAPYIQSICNHSGMTEEAAQKLSDYYIQDKEAQKKTGATALRINFLSKIIINGDLFRLLLNLELLNSYSKALLNSNDVEEQYNLNEKCDVTQLQITRMINKIMDSFDEREIQQDKFIEILKNVIDNQRRKECD